MYLLLLFALLYVRAVTKNENTSNCVCQLGAMRGKDAQNLLHFFYFFSALSTQFLCHKI